MILSLDRLTGICLAIISLATLLFWIPVDTETGLVEVVRRRMVIGDALAPTLAALICLICACALILRPGNHEKFSRKSFLSLAIFTGLFVLTLPWMRYLGPGMIDLLHQLGLIETNYRPLRGTIPIKYISFVLAGGLMIFALSAYIDKVFSWRRLGLCLLIALVIALIFDLPFEDIILPPNGDV